MKKIYEVRDNEYDMIWAECESFEEVTDYYKRIGYGYGNPDFPKNYFYIKTVKA